MTDELKAAAIKKILAAPDIAKKVIDSALDASLALQNGDADSDTYVEDILTLLLDFVPSWFQDEEESKS